MGRYFERAKVVRNGNFNQSPLSHLLKIIFCYYRHQFLFRLFRNSSQTRKEFDLIRVSLLDSVQMIPETILALELCTCMVHLPVTSKHVVKRKCHRLQIHDIREFSLFLRRMKYEVM